MTVTINGSTGVTSPEFVLDNAAADGGQVVLKSSGYSNWNWDNYSGRLRAYYNATEYFTIDATGNVGIGVTPSAWGSNYSKALQISTQGAYVAGNTSSYSAGTYAWFGNNGYLDSAGTFRYTNSTSAAQYSQVANTHIWSYAASGTTGNAITFTEAMRIDSSGNLMGGGMTSSAGYGNGWLLGPTVGGSNAPAISIGHVSGAASGSIYAAFGYNNAGIGSITQNGTTTVAYNTTSDYRLKENVQPMTGGLNTVAQLKPCTYTWKADGSYGQGFLAHELQAVVPDCVTGEKDAVDSEGNPVYQGIDTSFLVATLTAAIQELKAELDATKAEVAALKGIK